MTRVISCSELKGRDRPTTNYFVIFQSGSGQLLSNFVIFITQKLLYDI